MPSLSVHKFYSICESTYITCALYEHPCHIEAQKMDLLPKSGKEQCLCLAPGWWTLEPGLLLSLPSSPPPESTH